jgi:hypothetical protein
MIIAVNDLPVVASYGNPVLPDFPIEKVAIFVLQYDIIMQVTEGDQQPPAFNNPTETELKLFQGFHSLTPEVPWSAVRFKLPKGATGGSQGLITARFYSQSTKF